PVTVALAGCLRSNRLICGFAAEAGALTGPPEPRCASSSSAAASSSTASSSASLGVSSSGGSSVQENCSSSENGFATWTKWLIDPVGHGGTQSMQNWHFSGSTT